MTSQKTEGYFNWKLEQASKRRAEERGEEIASVSGFSAPPVDPFRIIDAERALIHAEGADFGDSFDGRLDLPPDLVPVSMLVQ